MDNAYKLVNNEKREIMEQAVFTASAILAVLGSQKDDVSANEAYKTYGKAWIIDRTRRGMLTTIRAGYSGNSTILYSRFEIESLKRAEKRLSEAFEKAEKKSEALSEFINQQKH